MLFWSLPHSTWQPRAFTSSWVVKDFCHLTNLL
jgi:hypothetical protein